MDPHQKPYSGVLKSGDSGTIRVKSFLNKKKKEKFKLVRFKGILAFMLYIVVFTFNKIQSETLRINTQSCQGNATQ